MDGGLGLLLQRTPGGNKSVARFVLKLRVFSFAEPRNRQKRIDRRAVNSSIGLPHEALARDGLYFGVVIRRLGASFTRTLARSVTACVRTLLPGKRPVLGRFFAISATTGVKSIL